MSGQRTGTDSPVIPKDEAIEPHETAHGETSPGKYRSALNNNDIDHNLILKSK